MKVYELKLPGVKIIEPDYYEDFRGYSCETYSAIKLDKEFDINETFVQDNHSLTYKKHTIRGIHFQINPKPQAKIVRCIRGKILDVVVDLRSDSPYFRMWQSIELSENNRKQLYIPKGYGHAFLTLEDNSEVLYKLSDFYEPKYDRAIAWNDPDINILWGVENPIISQKDIDAPLLKNSDVNFSVLINK